MPRTVRMKDLFHLKANASISGVNFIHNENLMTLYMLLLITNENASLVIFAFKKIESELKYYARYLYIFNKKFPFYWNKNILRNCIYNLTNSITIILFQKSTEKCTFYSRGYIEVQLQF